MLSDLERRVVQLVEEGYMRWKIAEQLGVGESTVRAVIKNLCTRYQCSMRELPENVPREEMEV